MKREAKSPRKRQQRRRTLLKIPARRRRSENPTRTRVPSPNPTLEKQRTFLEHTQFINNLIIRSHTSPTLSIKKTLPGLGDVVVILPEVLDGGEGADRLDLF